MTKNKRKERMLWEVIAGFAVLITIVFFIGVGVLLAFAPEMVSNNKTAQTEFGGMFFSAGATVETNERITTDAFVAGNRVVVENTVEDDLFVGANDVTVAGTIEGSLRAAGGMVIVDDEVDGNALLIGSTVWLKKDARMHGNVNILADTVIVDGEVDGKVGIAGSEVTLNGIFRDEVEIEADWVSVNSESRFSAAAEVESYELAIENGVLGQEYLTQKENDGVMPPTDNTGSFTAAWIWWHVSSLVGALIFGILLILVTPRWVRHVGHTMNTQKKVTWKNGLIFFLATPTALVLLVMTIIGAPLALVGGLFYIGLLSLGQLFTGMMLGLLLLRDDHEMTKEDQYTNRGKVVMQFSIGYSALFIISLVPIVGMLVTALAAIWGAGGIVSHYQLWRNRQS